MANILADRIPGGEAHRIANLAWRIAGALLTATLVFSALYFFVSNLE